MDCGTRSRWLLVSFSFWSLFLVVRTVWLTVKYPCETLTGVTNTAFAMELSNRVTHCQREKDFLGATSSLPRGD